VVEQPDGLMDALDQINARFGRGKAPLGLAWKGDEWRMRQENLSPSYTTRWGVFWL
jgi:DNA polymerase V